MAKIVKDASRLIDEAFEKAPDFAKPIVYKLRERVHSACPEIKEESSLWLKKLSEQWKSPITCKKYSNNILKRQRLLMCLRLQKRKNTYY